MTHSGLAGLTITLYSLKAAHVQAEQLLSDAVSFSQLWKLNSEWKQSDKLLTSVSHWSVKRSGTFPPLIHALSPFLVCHGSFDVSVCRWHCGGLLRHPVDRRLCARPLCQVLQSRSLLSNPWFSQRAARPVYCFLFASSEGLVWLSGSHRAWRLRKRYSRTGDQLKMEKTDIKLGMRCMFVLFPLWKHHWCVLKSVAQQGLVTAAFTAFN